MCTEKKRYKRYSRGRKKQRKRKRDGNKMIGLAKRDLCTRDFNVPLTYIYIIIYTYILHIYIYIQYLFGPMKLINYTVVISLLLLLLLLPSSYSCFFTQVRTRIWLLPIYLRKIDEIFFCFLFSRRIQNCNTCVHFS